MADASLFLRKRKDKQRAGRDRVPSAAAPRAPVPSSSSLNSHSAPSPSTSQGTVKAEPSSNGSNGNLTEIKIYSSAPGTGLRYNVMRLNSARDVDPTQLSKPVMMNRKKLGDRAPPIFALDQDGKIVGRYVYDNAGKPVLDANGEPVIEKKTEVDMSLVGSAPGQDRARRKTKKGTKEVHHQDIEVMRLRREELDPWILESSKPQEKALIPEHWVGRMQEASSLPTVLLINDGTTDGFEMVPLGRTYRFDPERPFKALDSDSANKLFEHQAKHKIHDRWALRPEGQTGAGVGDVASSVKVDREFEERAMRLEGRIRLSKGINVDRKPKIERYEDDYRRENRQAERGLEGGVDEELDFDEADEFQDDDDNNTFYRDVQEEEAAKDMEEKLRQEFRMANANVGDRPQISKADGEDDDDDAAFGKKKLDDEGKKLKRMFRKRREANPDDYDLFDDDDSDYDSDETDSQEENVKKEDADKNKGKDAGSDNEREKSLPPGEQRPSRPQSRGPGSRGTSSPTGRRPNPPMSGKASTAPPGSGAALLAQRAASRGASPRPSGGSMRAGSPLSGRAASPDNLSLAGRATSPPMRGSSPVAGRGTSPLPPGMRASSPASTPGSRDASPAPSASASQLTKPKSGKRKTTESPSRDSGPGPSPSSKRKSSPTGSVSSTAGGSNTAISGASGPRPKKAKKSSSLTPTPQPEEIPPFPGQITKQDVLNYFKSKPDYLTSMQDAIAAFRQRILQAGANRDSNQKLFLMWTKTLADQDQKMLRLKEEYR